VAAGSNTSTVALRFIGGKKKKETQCLGLKLGHPVSELYIYGELALQVRGVPNLRE
jgi:hypothetical protein